MKRRFTAADATRAANALGVRFTKFTAAEMALGMNIELEHRDVTHGALIPTAKIALAHLRERPDYYKRLAKYVERNPSRRSRRWFEQVNMTAEDPDVGPDVRLEWIEDAEGANYGDERPSRVLVWYPAMGVIDFVPSSKSSKSINGWWPVGSMKSIEISTPVDGPIAPRTDDAALREMGTYGYMVFIQMVERVRELYPTVGSIKARTWSR